MPKRKVGKSKTKKRKRTLIRVEVVSLKKIILKIKKGELIPLTP